MFCGVGRSGTLVIERQGLRGPNAFVINLGQVGLMCAKRSHSPPLRPGRPFATLRDYENRAGGNDDLGSRALELHRARSSRVAPSRGRRTCVPPDAGAIAAGIAARV